MLDVDGDKIITLAEFVEVVRTTPWAAKLFGVGEDQLDESLEAADAKLGAVFELLDRDCNGRIEMAELLQFVEEHIASQLPLILEWLKEDAADKQDSVTAIRAAVSQLDPECVVRI
eukprot:gnl/TRDRNA2_/TRDRNA2_170806_c0_seq2.p1 gnl/TRDRNA2_/TRDRNA2_170806_c0~~gnl/TRDRNA2_/TRDRNA2_170806_c0_seq2.p1  ORF type:complete len:116 (+),score=21.08 gnl/TRDRNA2_/TRDRNA2_170806_c0_seq2:299-646(+)